MNETVFTLRLQTDIAAPLETLAHNEGREMTEQITWLIVEALTEANLLKPALRDWLILREEVLSRFGQRALEIVQAEGHRTDIIANTAQRLMAEDATWRDQYAKLIEADPYAKGVKLKDRINPILGKRAKVLLGAGTGSAFKVPGQSIFTSTSHLIEQVAT